jgi:hypothetical protein
VYECLWISQDDELIQLRSTAVMCFRDSLALLSPFSEDHHIRGVSLLPKTSLSDSIRVDTTSLLQQ